MSLYTKDTDEWNFINDKLFTCFSINTPWRRLLLEAGIYHFAPGGQKANSLEMVQESFILASQVLDE